MSLENEYHSFKQELENEMEKLQRFENTEITEDENNPFSLEERIASKERGIKNCKKNIAELEELIEEVKEELLEFINEGGEVSESTLKELKEEDDTMETVYFKIEKNDVYINGYVEINDEEASDVDYYFFDQTGMEQPRPFYHCDEAVTGLTDELNDKIDSFENDYQENMGEIWDFILQSEEGENRTYNKFGFTITVGDD